jgi:predicted nucleotide-binding protein
MAGWTKETVVKELVKSGSAVLFETEIDHGVQLTTAEGTILCVYNTGTVVVQGKKSDERDVMQKIFKGAPAKGGPPQKAATIPAAIAAISPKKVFIVYGHDTASRNDLELIMLRLDLQPIILSNMVPKGQTIIEALDEHSEVHCAVVLLTPDDEGYPAGQDNLKKPRARQNVVLELGMFLSKVGRSRVIILHKGNLELPSDIAGLIYLPYKNNVSEVKTKLGAALQEMGFHIEIAKLSAE